MIVVAFGEVNPMRPQSYEKGMEYEKTKKSLNIPHPTLNNKKSCVCQKKVVLRTSALAFIPAQ